MADPEKDWRALGDPAEDLSVGFIGEYDITAIPNDFNLVSIVSFIDAKAIAIPGFQRNYVWDLSRASKLIESFLLGLPVPQVFLYQKDKGPLFLIDGQQRLMTIYYFVHGRFPRREARVRIRDLFDQHGSVPETALHDDELFSDFKLSLMAPDGDPAHRSPFDDKKYATLSEDDRGNFNLRTVRNVVIKQVRPSDDHSSMFEVFNRLNTGGVNLSPQELRMSLYDSEFMKLLLKLNRRPRWRVLALREEPDVRFRDVEVLLRAFGMLMWNEQYRPSMARFLNRFSAHGAKLSDAERARLEVLFDEFLASTEDLPATAFAVQGSERFNVALFEAVFAETLRRRLAGDVAPLQRLRADRIAALDADGDFRAALLEGTTKPEKVKTRLDRARMFVASE